MVFSDSGLITVTLSWPQSSGSHWLEEWAAIVRRVTLGRHKKIMINSSYACYMKSLKGKTSTATKYSSD